jgi:hypothetical protein
VAPVITTFRFQPFTSRTDTVMGVRFAYNADLVAALKASLARHRGRAFCAAARRYTAGGWLPEYKAWFVEEVVWHLVRADLEEDCGPLVVCHRAVPPSVWLKELPDGS